MYSCWSKRSWSCSRISQILQSVWLTSEKSGNLELVVESAGIPLNPLETEPG